MSNLAAIRHLGRINYSSCHQAMRAYTEERDNLSPDQLWLVEHDPIFTLGLAGKEEHILNKHHTIPILRTDRGGQVTYHGPGQIIIYLLIDLKRLNLSIRGLVSSIENGIINYLAERFALLAYSDRAAPGVYVNGAKIASLGFKIRKGCSYHGLSFNFSMDKTPFQYINPCGYAGLKVVNLADLAVVDYSQQFISESQALAQFIIRQLYH